MDQAQYAAFLSYSHRDKRWAEWLHRALETYRIPSRLRDHAALGDAQRRLRPIFRDREELPASSDLGARIEAALSASRVLIVLCSPAAAKSRWTNEEVATFKRLHPDRPILAAIVAGEPYASEIDGQEDQEAFPPALRFGVDQSGQLTGERAEPIAADFRADADGRRLGKLKLLAGMLGVGLDELVRRETARRNRHLAGVVAVALGGMTLTSGLAAYAFQQRGEAIRQREQADGLIEFMLTDLRKKLEPVGRLDVLDSVGEKALTYYAGQDLGALNADALGRRARALQLVGEVANTRGNLAGALSLFRQAAATTAEQLRRDPRNGQRIFDHAQSVYWVGYVAWQRGDRLTARKFFNQYRDYAERLAQVGGGNIAWQAELGHANINLGVLELDDDHPDAALRNFGQAQEVWARLRGAGSDHREFTYQMAQGLAWQADARRRLSDYKGALGNRLAEVAVYQALLARDAGDSKANEGLSVAWLRIAQLQLEQGAPARAVEYAGLSLRNIRQLEQRDPSNTLWKEMAVKSANMRTEALMMSRDWQAAGAINAWALDRARGLVAMDHSVANWRSECLMPAEWMEAAIVQARASPADARETIDRVLANFRAPGDLKSGDERFARIAVMTLSALNWRRLHDEGKAQAGFREARALLPPAGEPLDGRMAALARIVYAQVQAAEGTGPQTTPPAPQRVASGYRLAPILFGTTVQR